MEQNALITGATTGIGYAFAELLAAKGHSLALVARDRARLDERAKFLESQFKVRVIVLAKDLANPASPKVIFDELQRQNFPISILINNAGCGVFGRFAQTDLERDLAVLQVNMSSLVQLTKLFLKPMLDKREGRILNVASTTSFQPVPYLSIYSATKAFVHSFTCGLGVELEGSGVTVTSLCPGGTQTEFQKRAGMEHFGDADSAIYRPMTAASVAEIGYNAMMTGKPAVVAGWKNKLLAIVSRRVPFMWAARAAAKMNKSREIR